MSRTLKITGNQVKFTPFVMLHVSEEVKNMTSIFCRSMYETTIRFGFCDILNNQGVGKGYQADNPYLDL